MGIRSVFGLFIWLFVLSIWACPAYAGGKGKGKTKKAWKQAKEELKGQRKGWQGGDVPPGIAKQGEEKVAAWKARKAKSKDKLQRKLSEKNQRDGLSGRLSQEKLDQFNQALDTASATGGDMKTIDDLLEQAINGGLSGKEINEAMEAVKEGVNKGLDPNESLKKAQESIAQAKSHSRDIAGHIREWAARKAAENIRGQ